MTSVEVEAAGIWTGEAPRDAHLKSEDFLDVEKHPKITFAGKQVELAGADEAGSHGRVDDSRCNPHGAAAHPLSREVADSMVRRRSGQGTQARTGFTASATINRHDLGVSWNSTLDRGGVVVGNMVEITIYAEAILQEK